MDRRHFLRTTLAFASLSSAGLLASPASAQQRPLEFHPEEPLIPAPTDPSLWPEFRLRLAEWRAQRRRELSYADAFYQRPEFAWTSRCFSCCFLMLCDELFYDPARGRYNVKTFLDHGLREFGGFDAVVLWHAYPRIGFDDRNQFDFYRDMPGGLPGLRKVVCALQAGGVKVFIDYNPWDTGTRRDGADDLDALAEITAALGANGVFLDTMDRGAEALRARLDAARPGVALESEGALPLERVHDHHLSWAQWFTDSQAPGVLRNKWFERRHMQHQIHRWDRDHTAELQTAWMNGSGMMIWENVFGSWNGWSPRDRSILRTLLPIQRRFAGLFAGEQWTPLVPTPMPDVFASLWEAEDLRLWTLVNRSTGRREGALIQIRPRSGDCLFDLVAGRELVLPPRAAPDFELRGIIPPRGIGCLIAASRSVLGRGFTAFLACQRRLAERANWNSSPPVLRTTLQRARPAPPGPQHLLPSDMAAVPAVSIRLRTEFRIRECGFYDSTHPGLSGAYPQLHGASVCEREVSLKSYAIDLTPVTNADFAAFLKTSGYRPRFPQNFLKHWIRGEPPPGKADHPVVYVDLEDARAYARWRRKRLPTEEEWQYAAQGPDGLKYPWGSDMLPDRCNQGQTGTTTPVRAFPEGRSPFGVLDLCGNVWEWTESARSDSRTRFCIVRGGSFYQARGSDWYADGGPKPCDFAAKFLLMWPGLDRCATIGFRCAVSLHS